MPDSAPHTSPSRPSSWRTLAPCCGSRNALKRWRAGSKRTSELEPKSENLGEFELERTEVIGGEVMVSRAASEVLEPAHH